MLSSIFLFSVNLSIETSIFIVFTLSSIIGTYGGKYIQWIIKRSPLRNWENHKYEEFQEELALYVVQKSNIIFFIYFVYLLYYNQQNEMYKKSKRNVHFLSDFTEVQRY